MTRRPVDNGTTRGTDERAARSLSAPLLRFELRAESARLRAESQYLEGDRNALTLVKVDWFRLVLVALRAGARLDEIDEQGSIALQVLDGRVNVQVNAEMVELGEGELSAIAPGYPWAAIAIEDSTILIHLAWPPVPGSSVTG